MFRLLLGGLERLEALDELPPERLERRVPIEAREAARLEDGVAEVPEQRQRAAVALSFVSCFVKTTGTKPARADFYQDPSGAWRGLFARLGHLGHLWWGRGPPRADPAPAVARGR